MGRSLLAGNRASSALQHKLIQILSTHELRDLTSQLGLLIAKGLDLSMQTTNLIVNRNPVSKILPYLVRRCVFHLECLRCFLENR